MLNTIFLIGYMGAGKSAIGKSLSKNNGYKFYDLDKYIEEKTNYLSSKKKDTGSLRKFLNSIEINKQYFRNFIL